jgi:arylsulfatase
MGKGGTGTLYINDKKVGEGRLEKTVAARFGLDTLRCRVGHRVTRLQELHAPFPFAGTIEKIEIKLG